MPNNLFRSARTLVRAASVVLMLIAAGCAEFGPPPGEAKPQGPLVFPAPPDQARFIYERTLYSSADVVPDAKDASFRRMVTGEVRSAEGLGKPYAVAVHQGRIFVSDSAERFVKVFDVPTGRFFHIGEEAQGGQGELIKPLGLDVDNRGTLYVADATAKAVLVYDRDGKYQRRIADKGFDRLSSVTVDPKGDRLYVVDIGGVSSENHRVRVFEAASGKHLFDIGKRGKGPGEFNLPRDVAVGKDGRIYVVDGGNFRVQVFDHDGKYREAFGVVGKQLGNFARPKEIATDREGNVYVADAAFGNFQIFTADGELLMFVGARSEKDGPAKYMLPAGITVDEDGRIYFVDQWFRKVDIYRPVALKPEDGFLGRKVARAAR